MCDAPIFVNENGILLFKYRMARGTCYWNLGRYFSREGDLSRSDGDFYRVKSDLRTRPPLEGWTFEACPLGRQTQVPTLTFCGEDEEDVEESTDYGTSDASDSSEQQK